MDSQDRRRDRRRKPCKRKIEGLACFPHCPVGHPPKNIAESSQGVSGARNGASTPKSGNHQRIDNGKPSRGKTKGVVYFSHCAGRTAKGLEESSQSAVGATYGASRLKSGNNSAKAARNGACKRIRLSKPNISRKFSSHTDRFSFKVKCGLKIVKLSKDILRYRRCKGIRIQKRGLRCLEEEGESIVSAALSETDRGKKFRESPGKQVYPEYTVISIPGDRRCLFRAVAHGLSLRCGNGAPDERQQVQLADDLRQKVADELVKRRIEVKWFIEGDFDEYVNLIRQPHVWGGESELLMLTYVLKVPITVFLKDRNTKDGIIEICKYGQEYGADNPIRVLYDGLEHYEALQIHVEENV